MSKKKKQKKEANGGPAERRRTSALKPKLTLTLHLFYTPRHNVSDEETVPVEVEHLVVVTRVKKLVKAMARLCLVSQVVKAQSFTRFLNEDSSMPFNTRLSL